MNTQKTRIFLLLVCLLSIHACTVPDIPTGLPNAIPSEAPDTGETPCFQALQCIIENTGNNVLRKETQESVNQLFLLEEPEYTEFCQAKAKELTVRVPQCQL